MGSQDGFPSVVRMGFSPIYFRQKSSGHFGRGPITPYRWGPTRSGAGTFQRSPWTHENHVSIRPSEPMLQGEATFPATNGVFFFGASISPAWMDESLQKPSAFFFKIYVEIKHTHHTRIYTLRKTNSHQPPLKIGLLAPKGNFIFQPSIFRCELLNFRWVFGCFLKWWYPPNTPK